MVMLNGAAVPAAPAVIELFGSVGGSMLGIGRLHPNKSAAIVKRRMALVFVFIGLCLTTHSQIL
jgi:hypothetical protein